MKKINNSSKLPKKPIDANFFDNGKQIKIVENNTTTISKNTFNTLNNC